MVTYNFLFNFQGLQPIVLLSKVDLIEGLDHLPLDEVFTS